MAELNIEVYNTLNLISEELGRAYEETGYNPFDNGYILDNDKVIELLDNKKLIKPLTSPEFLEQGNYAVVKNFNLSLMNTEKTIAELENKLDSCEFKDELKETIVFLKNRKELLARAIEKLKDPNASSFELYEEIYNINPLLSNLFENSYLEEVNISVLSYDLLNNAKVKAKLKALKEEQIRKQRELASQKLLQQDLQVEKQKKKIRKEALEEFKKEKGFEPKALKPKKQTTHKHIEEEKIK